MEKIKQLAEEIKEQIELLLEDIEEGEEMSFLESHFAQIKAKADDAMTHIYVVEMEKEE